MDKILFFDGVCVMCNGLVAFVIKHDKNHTLKFATFQGSAAQRHIPQFSTADLKSAVFVDDQGAIHTESDAIINVLLALGGIFRVAGLLKLVPKSIRNAAYRFVAKNRYGWFGKTEKCVLLTKEQRSQVLD